MKRVPSHMRIWLVIIGGAVLVAGGIGAASFVSHMGGQAAADAGIPTSIVTGKPVTHTVVRVRKIHLPPRVIHRHGKRIVIPGRTITRRQLVTVSGPPVTVAGPTRTVRGPGGTVTVVRSVPVTGPTTTVQGPTSTVQGPTTTVPGPTTTIAGPPTTVFQTVFSTITETVTEPPPPPST